MTTRVWVGGAGGPTWKYAANWSPQGVPGPGDEAVLGAGTVIQVEGGPLVFGPDLTVDVTGAANLFSNEGRGQGSITNAGTINVGPGGDLALAGVFGSTGEMHVASGTLDLSGALTGSSDTTVVVFDDGAGKLLFRYNISGPGESGYAPQIYGFRAGDAIDIEDASASGPLSPDGSGTLAVGRGRLLLMGQTAPGATYTASPDGAGGTLVTTTAEPAATAIFTDQTTGATGSYALAPASGGPSYLQWQYRTAGTDTTAIKAAVPNVFLKAGAGTKALAAASGQNVLDGGTGSAFLTGGSGTDTFFVDLRGAAAVTWDTLTNFHAGDSVTVWGWVPGIGTETVDALDGAAGYQGATLRLGNGLGGPVSSVTLAGLSADQAAHLQMSTGTVGGLQYLSISNPGV